VIYSSNGKISGVETGPAFRESDTEALRNLISDKLLTRGAPQVACSVLLSTYPLRGWFRYKDQFQICPCRR